MSQRHTYEQAYEDRQYLWQTYGPADDMTGGYVDQDDLEALLKNPSKATARACLIRQIEYWFQKGPADHSYPVDRSDPVLLEIMDRYDLDFWF